MSNQSDNEKSLDLSALDFGPSWARNEAPQKKTYYQGEDKSRDGRRDQRRHSDRDERSSKRKFSKRRESHFDKPRRQHDPLPEGVRASIMPIEEGVDNLVKQISATGRTYSIFELARLILKSRERYNVCFSIASDSDLELFQATSDQATFLTREEALSHFSTSDKFSEFYKAIEVEVDAPKGNFPSIACCGFNDEPIAPPNYHGYQNLLSERHAASFSNISMEKYKARVKIERDEEKVAAWLESMTKRTAYQLASDESIIFETKAEAVNHFKMNGFAGEYPAMKKAFVRSDVPFKKLSSGLASGLIEVISEQNRYPGELSSFLCRQFSGRHLAVYKWQNKLHAGPSRPHSIPEKSSLADRPKAILQWVQENSGSGIDQLWKGVWPQGLSEEDKTPWFHDLHWMLNQGYLVLLENGHIHLSSDSKKKPAAVKKGSKKKLQIGKPLVTEQAKTSSEKDAKAVKKDSVVIEAKEPQATEKEDLNVDSEKNPEKSDFDRG